MSSTSKMNSKNSKRFSRCWKLGLVDAADFSTIFSPIDIQDADELYSAILKNSFEWKSSGRYAMIFSSEILTKQWHSQYSNRFIFTRIKIDFYKAQNIVLHTFIKSAAETFDRVPILGMVVAFYDGIYLYMGSYFTGAPHISVPFDRSFRHWVDDPVLNAGYEFKSAICRTLARFEKKLPRIEVIIRNALPPFDGSKPFWDPCWVENQFSEKKLSMIL
uniref:Uncharacterized protein n=1 Tax=Panagrolaimus sp. JU765 TaxID=591449 RepID=A0AC34RHV3_9BILA